ncbi:hypothetical protein [Aeromonas jandaei]|uniref:hypothetical protein n=1 Tax=Aeromonas jandaei TaxID=650 RepID=UPI003BA1D521
MSEFDEKIKQMRSLSIYANEGMSIFEILRNTHIPGWAWSKTGFPQGGHEFCLRKNNSNEFVALSFESNTSSRATSSNVIPYDWENDPVGANSLLEELSSALTLAGIYNSVIASANDRGI